MGSIVTKKDNETETKCTLPDQLAKGVLDYGLDRIRYGYENVVSTMISGRDLVVQKLGENCRIDYFLVGALAHFKKKHFVLSAPQILLLSPTRERAMSHRWLMQAILSGGDGNPAGICLTYACVGGKPMKDDRKALTDVGPDGEMVQVILGTPGRLTDLMNRDILLCSNIKMVILDHASYLLQKTCFGKEVTDILNRIKKNGVQVCIFTDTVTETVQEFVTAYTIDPVSLPSPVPAVANT